MNKCYAVTYTTNSNTYTLKLNVLLPLVIKQQSINTCSASLS